MVSYWNIAQVHVWIVTRDENAVAELAEPSSAADEATAGIVVQMYDLGDEAGEVLSSILNAAAGGRIKVRGRRKKPNDGPCIGEELEIPASDFAGASYGSSEKHGDYIYQSRILGNSDWGRFRFDRREVMYAWPNTQSIDNNGQPTAKKAGRPPTKRAMALDYIRSRYKNSLPEEPPVSFKQLARDIADDKGVVMTSDTISAAWKEARNDRSTD